MSEKTVSIVEQEMASRVSAERDALMTATDYVVFEVWFKSDDTRCDAIDNLRDSIFNLTGVTGVAGPEDDSDEYSVYMGVDEDGVAGPTETLPNLQREDRLKKDRERKEREDMVERDWEQEEADDHE